MKRTLPQNLAKGQAGVYQVASQLALRGHNPHFPAVDIGYDLLLDCGLRVQVKAANMRYGKPYPKGSYWFRLGRTTRVKNQQIFRSDRVFTDECDMVVFWGIDENRFWIIPPECVDNHQLVVLGPKLGFKEVDMAELAKLHEAGYEQAEIAEWFGVSQMTISRRLRNIFTEPSEARTLSATVRKLEDRWDLIDNLVIDRKTVLAAKIL